LALEIYRILPQSSPQVRERLLEARISACRQGIQFQVARAFRRVLRRTLALAFGLALVLASPPLIAQQPDNVSLNTNEQLFSILAALNAAAYDTGLGMDTGDKTRDEVRSLLAAKQIPVLPEIKKFYEEHRIAGDSGADLGQFVSLGLLLGPPPNFALTVPQTDLPPDAKKVVGLVPLLKRFYEQANLLAIWSKVQPRYEAEVERYSGPVRRSVELSDAYLRFPSGAYLGRKYSIDLSLLAGPEQVQARIYGANYYLVVTPSQQPKLAEIRHQYLHFLLDPLAIKFAPLLHQKAALLPIARVAPKLGQDFKDDFPLLATECLIRAVELRMDKVGKAAAENSVKELTESGLILVPYFYAGLAEYEKQEPAMSVYYREMIEGIDLEAEKARLGPVKFAPRPQPAEPAEPGAQIARTEEERLLDQGDNAIYENRYSDAQAAFKTVLERFDATNERALFGLAIAFSNTRKPDTAEEYFHKVLDTANDVRLATWSHIYLGRISDLKGQRKEALAQYRAASLTSAAYPEAQRAVQRGLEKAFGSSE
jgi:TolA-binding protein